MVLCCGQEATIQEDSYEGNNGWGVFCQICGHAIFDIDKNKAIANFQRGSKKVQNKIVPVRNNSMRQVFESKRNEIEAIASPILSNDKSAMERLLTINTERYPLTLKGGAWDNIWSTDVGQLSIVTAIEEALIMGIELGKMGDIVPFGDTCQLIPSVEAFEFTLTNGNNAPFENITIECIYDGDDYRSGRKDGNFFLDFESFGKERKKVIKVAVYGTLKKTGLVIGEMYDAERLLEKAEIHSLPYKKYMTYMRAYEYQKSEGNVKKDPNGREYFTYFEVAKTDDKYFEKSVEYFKQAEASGQLKTDSKGEYAVQTLPKKAGGTFDKKIYRYEIEGGMAEKVIFVDELVNPYSGADQPEMLRKSAGKSFLAKYAKVRNSEAVLHEVKTSKGAMKQAVDLADRQFID